MKFFEWLRGRSEPSPSPMLEHEERRKLPRMRCFLKVQGIDDFKQPWDAYVVDMSSQGIRLHSARRLPSGEAFDVKFNCAASLVTVPAMMVWSKEGRGPMTVIGARLLLPQEKLKDTWVGYILQQLGFPLEHTLASRRTIRYRTHLAATAQAGNEEPVDVTVLDIGGGGALIESPCPLEEGVILELLEPPGLPSRLRLVCRCVNARQSPLEGRVLCHLKWVYLTPEETKKLGVLLSHQLHREEV